MGAADGFWEVTMPSRQAGTVCELKVNYDRFFGGLLFVLRFLMEARTSL
jgi:hypothetical protein